MSKKRILFLGCGKMGSAIVKNLLSKNIDPSTFLILKPTRNNQIEGVRYVTGYDDFSEGYKADIVFFCIKPQHAKEAITEFVKRGNFTKDTIFISILAGKKISFFKNFFGADSKIIRLMPNLPTLIGQGIFSYFSDIKIDENIFVLLNAIGEAVELEDENLMDAVTAISGGGPAYLFLFAKLMIDASVKLGLDEKTAGKLVRKTIYGSSKMIFDEASEDLENMIQNVASKGGSTNAALEIFAKNNFDKIIFEATKAAFDRSKKLADLDESK